MYVAESAGATKIHFMAIYKERAVDSHDPHASIETARI
jgi:hypothetical protein